MALNAISRRYAPKKLAPLHSKPIHRKSDSKPLFDPDEEEAAELRPVVQVSDDDDEALAFAIQESLDHQSAFKPVPRNEDDFIPSSSRLETALSIAIPTPSRKQHQSAFGIPTLLITPPKNNLQLPSVQSELLTSKEMSDSDDDMEELPIPRQAADDDDDDMEELPIFTVRRASSVHDPAIPSPRLAELSDVDKLLQPASTSHPDQPLSRPDAEKLPAPLAPDSTKDTPVPTATADDNMQEVNTYQSVENIPSSSKLTLETMDEHIQRSRSNSPFKQPDEFSRPSSPIEVWDAAQEMDPEAEVGDFAEFVSQIKGKDLDDVRREIEDEIATLDQQRKAAMRDSEDITQQMISQIMVCTTSPV